MPFLRPRPTAFLATENSEQTTSTETTPLEQHQQQQPPQCPVFCPSTRAVNGGSNSRPTKGSERPSRDTQSGEHRRTTHNPCGCPLPFTPLQPQPGWRLDNTPPRTGPVTGWHDLTVQPAWDGRSMIDMRRARVQHTSPASHRLQTKPSQSQCRNNASAPLGAPERCLATTGPDLPATCPLVTAQPLLMQPPSGPDFAAEPNGDSLPRAACPLGCDWKIKQWPTLDHLDGGRLMASGRTSGPSFRCRPLSAVCAAPPPDLGSPDKEIVTTDTTGHRIRPACAIRRPSGTLFSLSITPWLPMPPAHATDPPPPCYMATSHLQLR